ncbi:hypothetical protein COZ78_02015 [bacterium (Candidatus Gribaldobacteria) CG_4_8_14_3_um_filter_42_11]|uniref:Uncharacterized protein n=4 Tax=Candidatus Gribaldobacteria TaxID=2798536 RepID=A0A2M7IY68_9BACT|nr:MAG: hypothetical protein COS21_01555 [bacterium (Candidatus Gribaldobacteria) CG02_land_8_20_14_3_00_41_15]PIX03127.1 MAG: hypothetical protein COZ78_02015 [bacterium (Candidatus Gribaldobacteria) CG_4_8_14_3_um_filter_42_11]
MFMKKILIVVLIVVVVALAGVVVYQKLNQPETTPIVVNQPVANQSENQPKNCAKEGEINSLSAAQGGGCCSGLTSVSPANTFDSACNIISSQQHIEACVLCGNGVCGKGENQCNCPQDCRSEITIGKFNIDQVKVSELQSAIDEGHQPWRLDTKMVLKADGLAYGFTADELENAKNILTTGSAGVAQYEISHNSIVYTVSLIQPVVGENKIWMIGEISQK